MAVGAGARALAAAAAAAAVACPAAVADAQQASPTQSWWNVCASSDGATIVGLTGGSNWQTSAPAANLCVAAGSRGGSARARSPPR